MQRVQSLSKMIKSTVLFIYQASMQILAKEEEEETVPMMCL